MKIERITKDMLSADTQLGGAFPNPLAGAMTERPDSINGSLSMQEFESYCKSRRSWSERTQPGGGTMDFSDDGHDRMACTLAGIPQRDDGDGD